MVLSLKFIELTESLCLCGEDNNDFVIDYLRTGQLADDVSVFLIRVES